MRDTEEDEDVVFQGSAIYQHLHDTGFTDFESTQLITSPCQEDFTKDNSNENFEYIVYKDIVEYITHSKLVNNDDWLVLEHFMPSGEELRVSGCVGGSRASWHEVYFFIGRVYCVQQIGYLCVFLLRLILLLVIPLLCLASGTWLIYIGIIILTFSVFLIVEDVYIYLCYFILSHDIKKFVLLLKEASQSASKSVRVLQEIDLITKGFVLAQGSSPGTFCENTEFPQCSNLCYALNCTVSSLVQVLHQNHRYLELCSPEYPCMRELFDQLEVPDIKETGYNTENITLLKKWVAVAKLQVSAVLTELLLCLHKPAMFHKLYSSRNQLFSYKQVFLVSRDTKTLISHLEYTRSFWLQDREEERKPVSFEEKKKNVYIALHSLSLHMQAALFRVQGLENMFESDNSSMIFSQELEQEKLKVLPSYEYMREQLDALKTELDSCQWCLEEAEARVDRKYGMNDSVIIPKMEHLDNADKVEDTVSSQEVKRPAIVLYDMEEPVVEDEVFEAYIDEESCNRQEGDYDDDFWKTNARKERQILKQQKAQGRRVLSELQPVLVKRRKMWEKREMDALNRQNVKEAQASNVDGTQTEQTRRKSDFKKEKLLDNLTNDSDSSTLKTLEELKIDEDVEEVKIQCDTSCHFLNKNKLSLDCVVQDNEEETDSDEERLQIYRKIKQELDEDEKTRMRESDEEEERAPISVAFLKSSKNSKDPKELINFDNEEIEDNGKKFQKEEKHTFSLPIVQKSDFNKDNHSEQEFGCEDQPGDKNDANEDTGTDPLSDVKAGAVQCDTGIGGVSKEEKDVTFDTEFKSCLIGQGKSPPPKFCEVEVMKDEEFVHNKDIDEDSSHQIDWSVITLPAQHTETIEERMELFSAGQNIGFQAEVAAEAQAVSRRFWTTSNLTETFGGVGEGEEVFGDDDDSTEEDE
ncbi:Vezatin-like [Homarus americanus]|uniref:Vezatin-like n=1 Tax=Homarus americanus TaxID=6706 RepID=A0A8J5MQB4_HOMAM|nr:Vezatin-like [Homarus americanus]